MILKYRSIQANLYSDVIVDFLNSTGMMMGTERSEWAATYAPLVYTLGN